MNEELRWTSDLNIFKPMMGNRDVKKSEMLEKSIREHGFLANPILANEKYESSAR